MRPQAGLLLNQPRPTAWPTFAYYFGVPCCPSDCQTPVLFPSFSFSWFIVLVICTIKTEKKSARLFPNLTNQMSQRYFRERPLEAVLSLRKQPGHALLEVTADRAPLFYRIRMNRKCRWRRTGTVYIQQRDLPRRTRKHARSALAPLGYHQACF